MQKKDKKKGKDKPKATDNNTQEADQKKQENKPDQTVVSTMQTLAEARMAASSIASNSKTKNKEDASAAKSVKNEIRKYESLAGTNTNAPPRKLPPIEKHNKTAATSKETAPRRKITPHRPPQVGID